MQPRSWIHEFRIQNTVGSAATQQDNPYFFPDVPEFNLSTKTLVVPIVSAANVSQLAVDIIIASFSLSRLGIFDSKYHIPVVGGREGFRHGVTTPLELFGKDDVDFVVIQQRSPVLKAQKHMFISALLQFVKDSAFKSVLFVSGVNSTNRTDAQMHVPLYHHWPAPSLPTAGSPLASLVSWPQYSTNHNPPMPGGGITRQIISSIPEDWTVDTGFLIWMGMEGDNRGDAILTANAVARILSVEGLIQEWKQPDSWKQGLFGTPNDQSLFG